ncbi:MAG: SpoIIE family protein phosphatase [bacterium]|nr:SpoIIE family protein phosphatase [bacterium]
MKKAVYAVIFFLFIFNISFAQKKSRIKFEKLSVTEGLTQSSVICMLHDSRGFMWFATLDGLNKYNGYDIKVYWNSPNKKNALTDNIINVLYETEENPTFWIGTNANGLCKYNRDQDNFTSFKHDPNNTNSLSNNVITSIAGDNKTLWIGTLKGLNKFEPQKNKFSRYNRDYDSEFIPNDTINVLVIDKNENIWIGTKNGLCKFNSKDKSFKSFFKENGLIDNEIATLLYHTDGNLYIGSESGLLKYDLENEKFIELTSNITNTCNIKDVDVTSILEDINGDLWIGTRTEGLVNYKIKSNSAYLYTHNAAEKHSLSTNNILTIYKDKSDIIWIGTSLGGVNKWNRAADDLAVFRHSPYDDNSLSASQVRCIYTDKSDVVWIGTVEGGLNKWDKNGDKFVHFKHNYNDPNSLSHNHVRSILEDSKGKFWIATDGGGLNLYNRKTNKFTSYKSGKGSNLSHNRVWKIMEDSKSKLWVGTFGGGLNLFDRRTERFKVYRHNLNDETSISSDLVTSVYEDSKGNIWIGTFGGLNKLYPESDKFLRYLYNEDDINSLSNNRVYCIFEDEEGYLWVGTKGGLNKFDFKTGNVKRFTTDNSDLPNNVILGILEEKGNIWVSTNNGISRINKNTDNIKNFDIGDGLQSYEFLAGSAYKSKDGQLFFGGIDGFNAFYPENVTDNPNKPPIVITRFRVSNQDIRLDSSITVKKVITLKYFQNDISFDFVALDFIFPLKNKYAYKLVGYDENWIDVKHRRFAEYTNLSPKEYTFRVIGSNNDDVWNKEGTSLKIIIKPAFWQTLWFKILCILLIVFSVIAIYRIRVRTIKKRNKELERQVRNRTAEIRQQNEEIKTQRDEISKQKDVVVKKSQEIADSIHYAKRIQTAALPSDNYMKTNMPEHFILFKPRDIVSGDFYWAERKGDIIVITAADCTGHGVPGAFMSMLGVSFLNKIVNEDNITQADEILNKLRDNVIYALHQSGDNFESKDGMDISLCVINLKTRKLQFAGAFNPLLIIRENKVNSIKADRMPVAIYDMMEPFSLHEREFKEGDMIYMFSDGYPDQFGGPRDKKFMVKRMKSLLLENSNKPMLEQKEILNKTIEEWRGKEIQIDDIVVVGIRL